MTPARAPTAPAPPRSTATWAAYGVTYLLSPLTLPPVVTAAAAQALGAGPGEVLASAAVALVANGLVPLAVLVAMVRRGAARTLEVRERSKRALPFAVGVAGSLLAAWGFALVADGPRGVLVPLALWQALNVALLWAITAGATKVSVHLYAVASSAAIAAWLAATGVPALRPWAVGLALLVPLVAWARLRLGAHTRGQVALGAALGAVLVPLELWMIDLWLSRAG